MAVVNPKKSIRATTETGEEQHYFELFLAPGPREIGVTGDNSYDTLFSSNWCAVIEKDTDLLRVFQEVDGAWVERTNDSRMPPVVGTKLPENARSLSFAFDQSARIALAYESGRIVTGTRWDTTERQYKQNINFAGFDPCLINDATLVDPRGLPDGMWEAYQKGFSFSFLWTPNGQRMDDNAIQDSDVLLFYMPLDRTAVMARVQRQIYQNEHVIFNLESRYTLDRVQALFGKYQILLSPEDGSPARQVLVSDDYVDELTLATQGVDPVGAGVTIFDVDSISTVHATRVDNTLDSGVVVMDVSVIGDTLALQRMHTLSSGVTINNIDLTSSVFSFNESHLLTSGVEVNDLTQEVVIIPTDDDDSLIGGIQINDIRLQTLG